MRVMPVVTAAVKIVRGIEKSRAIIPITLHAWIFWWAMRLCPPIALFGAKMAMRDLRKKIAEVKA